MNAVTNRRFHIWFLENYCFVLNLDFALGTLEYNLTMLEAAVDLVEKTGMAVQQKSVEEFVRLAKQCLCN